MHYIKSLLVPGAEYSANEQLHI